MRLRQEDCCETDDDATLGYTVESSTAWATGWDSISNQTIIISIDTPVQLGAMPQGPKLNEELLEVSA